MKAAFITKHGFAEEIKYGDFEDPVCTDNHVLVKVLCASVNNVDTFVRSGRYKTPIPFPFIIGRDMVGTVVEAGSMTTGFKPGDTVWTNSMGYDGRQGVTAEYVCIPHERLYPLPSGVSEIKAAASVHSSATAVILLTDVGKAHIGERILIHGAAGHVGTKLVSLAHQMGLDVTTTSNVDDFESLRLIGADHTFNYHEQLSVVRLKHGFDLIIDTSGKVALQKNIELLNTHGRILLLTPAPVKPLDTWQLYTKTSSILGFVISQASVAQLHSAAQIINSQFIKELLLDDEVRLLDASQAALAHTWQEMPEHRKMRFVLMFR